MKHTKVLLICLMGAFVSTIIVSTSLSSLQPNNPLSISNSITQSVSQETEATPQPICAVQFTQPLTAGQQTIQITGRVGANFTLSNLTTQEIITDSVTINQSAEGYLCEGLVLLTLPDTVDLTGNHMLYIESDDGSYDAAVVQPDLTAPTLTPQATVTPTTTPTPLGSFIFIEPACGFSPTAYIRIRGFNWITDESVIIVLDNALVDILLPDQNGSFDFALQRTITEGTSEIIAQSASTSYTVEFEVPCPNVTPTSTLSK